jgi:GT2 family glycosyltransferase
MKISIVCAYYNRRSQLLKTLESISHYGEPEIIIVDDASAERIDDLPVKLIRIDPEQKRWFNPCVPYNIGFSKATGDIIVIQNPECIHVGDILSYVKKLKRGELFSFAAYSLDVNLEYDKYDQDALKKFIMGQPQRIQVAHHGWYNHSVYRPEALHFCNAIFREDLKKIGGFDERFSQGVSFDDNEILIRIKRAGMKINIIDDPFVIHQKHERTDYANLWEKRLLNEWVFSEILKETRIKPPQNKYYP